MKADTRDGLRAAAEERHMAHDQMRISTKNPTALNAIYDFLRFQIKEHKTGDSPDINKRN